MSRTNKKITIPVSIGYGLTDIMGGRRVYRHWCLAFILLHHLRRFVTSRSSIHCRHRPYCGCGRQPVYGQLY